MEYLDLAPVSRMTGTVRLPGSKSISNRTLLLAALARGDTEVSGLLDAEDVDRMLDALRALGVTIEHRGDSRDCVVHGVGGAFAIKRAKLFLGNAGTALRPLTAVLAFCGGEYELSGLARMHERPIGDLVAALRPLGAEIRYLGSEGFPPLAIGRGKLRLGGSVAIRGGVSSQFLSALLLALPLGGKAMTVDITGELISKPYVEMTLNLMASFGVEVESEDWRRMHVPAAGYISPGMLAV
ncbi:MAG TPA: 3-phosphoshikimate 1-carboxyvinyltransferase, partial [Casimicrobiaceae bacterium]|nr:3-phosphoshikimate 1-carboxyvinyltransferase [Casimicrobiaceae bacterium]